MKKRGKKQVTVSPNSSKVEITIRRFIDAPDDRKFVLNDGRVLKNIKELADALEHISDESFSHHANVHKNDFSRWVSDILQEKELAEDLQRVDNKLHAQIAILKHIAKRAF